MAVISNTTKSGLIELWKSALQLFLLIFPCRFPILWVLFFSHSILYGVRWDFRHRMSLKCHRRQAFHRGHAPLFEGSLWPGRQRQLLDLLSTHRGGRAYITALSAASLGSPARSHALGFCHRYEAGEALKANRWQRWVTFLYYGFEYVAWLGLLRKYASIGCDKHGDYFECRLSHSIFHMVHVYLNVDNVYCVLGLHWIFARRTLCPYHLFLISVWTELLRRPMLEDYLKVPSETSKHLYNIESCSKTQWQSNMEPYAHSFFFKGTYITVFLIH